MTHYQRSPRRLGSAMEQIQGGLAPDTLLAEVQGAWPATVGEAIAAQAQPVAERAGVLTVACAASVWAQELDLMGPEVLERLNATLRRGALTRLRCVATPPPGM